MSEEIDKVTEEVEKIIRDHNRLMCQKYSTATRGDVNIVTGQKIFSLLDQARHQLHTKIKEVVEGLEVDEVNPYKTVEEAKAHNRALNLARQAIDKIMEER